MGPFWGPNWGSGGWHDPLWGSPIVYMPTAPLPAHRCADVVDGSGAARAAPEGVHKWPLLDPQYGLHQESGIRGQNPRWSGIPSAPQKGPFPDPVLDQARSINGCYWTIAENAVLRFHIWYRTRAYPCAHTQMHGMHCVLQKGDSHGQPSLGQTLHLVGRRTICPSDPLM